MSKDTTALQTFAISLADDSLILGQRLSEWCYQAPYLEEDLALANTALDYLGRANNLYEYAVSMDASGRTVDDFALRRDTRDFSNLLICELPIGDFAFSIARQFILDTFYLEYLRELSESVDEQIALIAAKSLKETQYHFRRSREWVMRLGDGTDESKQRIQKAFDELWGYVPEMFAMSPAECELLSSAVAVNRADLKPAWDETVERAMAEATLLLPEQSWEVHGGRDGIHTDHHGPMIAEMQFLQRAYPGLEW